MNYLLLGTIGLIYFMTAVNNFYHHNYPMALVFIAYAVSNIGLMLLK